MRAGKKLWWSIVFWILMPSVAWAEPFGHIVAFGDSLTDNGNLYRLSGHLIPNPHDYKQGRFSNGPVWVEYLAEQLRISDKLSNYAYGGAKTGRGFPFGPPGLLTQVHMFISESYMPENAIFTVWIGANDLLYGKPEPELGVQNIVEALDQLVSAGAVHVLILNLPNLGAIPANKESPDSFAAQEAYSITFNRELDAALDDFSYTHPKATLHRLNIFELFQEVLDRPEDFGFAHVDSSCPNFGVNFENEGRYVFWDELHPTTEAHALIGSKAADLVSTGCVAVDENLDMAVPCALYKGQKFGFTLAFHRNVDGETEGIYWKMKEGSLGRSDVGGPHCVSVEDDLSVFVPCGGFQGRIFEFGLRFTDDMIHDPFGLYWKLDPDSLASGNSSRAHD